MKLRVLGCGTSAGIPAFYGMYGRCDPENPKNNRLRTSLLIQEEGENWLIDAGPDLRQQLITAKVDKVHGVFLTHAHADHTLGLNDLKPFFAVHRDKIPLYADDQTFKGVRQIFGFLIDEGQKVRLPIYRPFLTHHLLKDVFMWKNHRVQTFLQDHGGSFSRGFRFGNWAYSTDVKELSDEALKLLQGIDLWFVDCLSITERPTHAHLEKTLEWIEILKPQKAILIHMGPEMDYDFLGKRLPSGVCPAYDGMEVDSQSLKILNEKN